MPTSVNNPKIILPLDVPNRAGGMPETGQPYTWYNGIQLNMPLQKAYMSGAVRRQLAEFSPNGGNVLAASTAYPGFVIVPRASLITAIYLVLGVVPTVANATLAVTCGGTSLLAGANFTVLTSLAANTIISIPLATSGVFNPLNSLGQASSPPYVQLNGAFPNPILITYTEGASTVKSSNVLVVVESEADDFSG